MPGSIAPFLNIIVEIYSAFLYNKMCRAGTEREAQAMAKKKRGNGEGTIYRRKNGGWATQYIVYTAKGRKRKTIYGKTRAEVAAQLAKALSDRESGLTFDAENLKLGEYLEGWLTDSVKNSVRDITYKGYERLVRNHITPTIGSIRLKALTPTHLRGLYRNKTDASLSPRTVQYIHVTLHKALKQAVNDGLVPRNVTETVKPPQLRREEIKPLTSKQTKMLLNTIRGNRLEALYVLAISAGLRQGELLGLKWEDVDLEHGTLQVRRTLSGSKNGNPIFGSPKTAKGKRSVTLTEKAIEALKRHRELQVEEKQRLAGLWQDHGLVFVTRVGTPINRRNLVIRSFKPLLSRAGLPEIRFHDLRHTCATLMLCGGIHPKVVQELLGHASVTVTLDTYSHVLPTMQGEAAVKMNSILS
jgi:integrase